MAGALIPLILSFMLLFALTREVWVRVINREFLTIEIHLPIFALILTKENKSKQKKSSKKQKKLSALTYIQIFTKTLKRLEKCELVIKKLAPPQKQSSFSYSTVIKPYGYQSLIYGLIAYLDTRVQRVTLCENAVTYIPDNPIFLCDVTVKARLFEILFGAFCLYKNIKKEKRYSFS